MKLERHKDPDSNKKRFYLMYKDGSGCKIDWFVVWCFISLLLSSVSLAAMLLGWNQIS